jgi:hypothetical protein
MRIISSALGVALLASVAAAQSVPAPGDLAVSEIVFNPGPDACVTDNNGEYFELTNISTKVLDLNGLFFQDATITAGVAAPTGVFFRIVNPGPVLLYPGQKYLLCRSANSAVNGGLTNVDYEYTAATVPADNSKVGTTSMNLNNRSTGDGIFITVGGPAIVPTPNPNGYVAGTIIESVSYCATSAPFTSSGNAQGAERKDLFSPMVVAPASSPLANSSNLAVSTATKVSCVGNTYVGTPRERNSTDITNWPTNTNYDSVNFPNSGALKAVLPLSIGAGIAEFTADGGALAANGIISFGYADSLNGAAEWPISLFLPGNPGSIVIDLPSAGYDNSYVFDGSGKADFTYPLPPNPLFIGMTLEVQWVSVDANITVICSNGVRVQILN